MRILANENIPASAINALRKNGHDVVWAATDMRGQADTAVLSRADQESRLVLTQDKDFGELAFRSNLRADSGVMLIRIQVANPVEIAAKIMAAIETRDSWAGVFAVVEDALIRIRPLPPAAG